MSDIIIQKLDKKARDRARLYYFSDYSLSDICEIMNIDMDTLRFYVFGENGAGSNENCWFQLKKNLGPASVAVWVKDKVSSLEKTSGLALNLINENLKRIERKMKEDPDETLSVDDTKKLAGILADMDKIIRLESGQATQIVENVGLSRAEAIRILAEDPFAQTIEVNEGDWEELSASEGASNSNEIIADIGVEKPWKK